MQEIKITENQAGQRFDKFLFKYFKEATSGFIYKMLRKKNIVLNGKKSDGKEKLNVGDSIKIFMADETISKFRGESKIEIVKPIDLDIVYEDEDVLIINKPSGMLSQKAEASDVSINEYIISYLVSTNQLTEEQLKTFKPGVCNRLDRNTSGLIIAGKSLKGLQTMSKMFKERTMDKYYLALVNGKIENKIKINGYLYKDEKTNKVTIYNKEHPNSQIIETEYEPVFFNDRITLLKVKLITGRTHQIRAHLSSVAHSIIGDYKYGNKKINDIYKKKYNIKDQMLHSRTTVFPQIEGDCSNLSCKEFTASLPNDFINVLKSEFKDNIEVDDYIKKELLKIENNNKG